MHNTSSKRWILVIGGSLVVLSGSASADAAYQDTTQITGGALVQMLRSIPFMPKSAKQVLEPMVTNVELRGNQLARVSKSSNEHIDLDQETITHIDNDKKSFTVTTFDEMREAFKDTSKKLADAMNDSNAPAAGAEPQRQPQYKVTFDVSVVDTGTSKTINGVAAKEQVLTMKAHVTPVDPTAAADPAQSVTYNVITDIWSAPEPPEMRAVDDFYVRYGKKLAQGVDSAAILKSMQPGLNQSGMSSLFASQPSMGAAMPDMMKRIAAEMEKIKGVRLLTITRIGGEGMVAPSADAATATGAVSEPVNKLGVIGSAFGNSVMGAFRHTLGTSPSTAPPPDDKGGQTTGAAAVLYEMTTQKGSFSQDPVSAAFFQIPAGYVKVESSSRTQMK